MENVLSLPSAFSQKYEYREPADIAFLFSSDAKITHLIEFICSELEELRVRYHNEKLEMMPVVFFEAPTQNKAEFITIEYSFFLQCIARYIHKFGLGDARKFVNDFVDDGEYPETKRASLFLIHGLLESLLRVVYVNGNSPRTKAVYLKYSVTSIWENSRCKMEFSGINLHVSSLEIIMQETKGLTEKLKYYSKISEARQLAFGMECKDFWKKSGQKPLYFMSKQNITHIKR